MSKVVDGHYTTDDLISGTRDVDPNGRFRGELSMLNIVFCDYLDLAGDEDFQN